MRRRAGEIETQGEKSRTLIGSDRTMAVGLTIYSSRNQLDSGASTLFTARRLVSREPLSRDPVIPILASARYALVIPFSLTHCDIVSSLP